MSRYTYIAFYPPKHGGKFHLPDIGWAADEDYAACRPSTILDTRINALSVTAWAALIEEGKHSRMVCGRCARIAVSRAEEVN